MWRILFLILVLMSSAVFAQTKQSSEPADIQKTSKVEEFGNVPLGQLRSLLDNFFNELQSDPTAKGYIFIYGTRREAVKREKLFRNHIVFRKVDPSQITFARGKNEIELRTQFWVVPEGAKIPTP